METSSVIVGSNCPAASCHLRGIWQIERETPDFLLPVTPCSKRDAKTVTIHEKINQTRVLPVSEFPQDAVFELIPALLSQSYQIVDHNVRYARKVYEMQCDPLIRRERR